MIDYLAKRMARFAVSENGSEAFDEQAYVYGFSLLLSTVISVMIILNLAAFAGRLVESLFFMGSIILTRTKGGGFHAKSHACCIALFTVTFLAVTLILKYMPESFFNLFILFMSGFGAIVIWLYAPVAAANKPVSAKKHERHRDHCILIACVYMVFSVFTCYVPVLQRDIVLFLYAGYGSAVISMLSTGIKNEKERVGNA